ncbi:MAG: hypothetical protein IKQ80_01050 [Clostridia bacterium]|nr:hypothetical protein [Clostridia bacterium]
MKRLCAFVALALGVLFASANAQSYYSNPGELYYHEIRRCAGTTHAEAPGTDGLYPCPVCVQAVGSRKGAELYHLGGLALVRVSDGWLADKPLREFDSMLDIPWQFSGADAERQLTIVLHGAEYQKFRNAAAETGYASAEMRYPDAQYRDHCGMGRVSWGGCYSRHIGDQWIEVMPTVEAMEALTERRFPGAETDFVIFLQVYAGPVTYEGQALTVDKYAGWWTELRDPAVTDLSGEAPEWAAECDGARLKLYRADGINLLTVETGGVGIGGEARRLIDGITLTIDGCPEEIYAHHQIDAAATDDLIYGCVLTDAEAAQLMRGGRISYAEGSTGGYGLFFGCGM